MIVFPNCKINLGLHILEKRVDGFHNLETVFYPIAIQDALEIVENTLPANHIEYSSSGIMVSGRASDNICVKAYQLLRKNFPQLPSVKLHLYKTIPMGAGLGGGSADGAFTLRLLNKKFNLCVPEERLIEYALQLGSDCPFFIKNTPCYASGRGEVLDEIGLDLSPYKFVVVNSGIHINTAWAFSQITPCFDNVSIKEVVQSPVESWKDHLKNSFEEAVFRNHSEVKSCKEKLYESGAIYASMSGSGSTVYGIFKKEAEIDFNFPLHYFVKII